MSFRCSITQATIKFTLNLPRSIKICLFFWSVDSIDTFCYHGSTVCVLWVELGQASGVCLALGREFPEFPLSALSSMCEWFVHTVTVQMFNYTSNNQVHT